MITKEKAAEIAENYIKKRDRTYLFVDTETTRIKLDDTIPVGRLEGQIRDVWAVPYEVEMYDLPDVYFVYVDAETGQVLFTIGPHNYVEDREEAGFE